MGLVTTSVAERAARAPLRCALLSERAVAAPCQGTAGQPSVHSGAAVVPLLCLLPRNTMAPSSAIAGAGIARFTQTGHAERRFRYGTLEAWTRWPSAALACSTCTGRMATLAPEPVLPQSPSLLAGASTPRCTGRPRFLPSSARARRRRCRRNMASPRRREPFPRQPFCEECRLRPERPIAAGTINFVSFCASLTVCWLQSLLGKLV